MHHTFDQIQYKYGLFHLLSKRQLQTSFLFNTEQQHQVMVPGLTLLDGRVERHHEEHLPGILVRQEEKTQYCRHGDLVVEGLTVELEECLENFDVVATTEEEKMRFV